MNKVEHQLPAVRWTESEAGWGQRPDGFTVHRDEAEVKRYIDAYWAAEKARNTSGITPSDYSFAETGFYMIGVSRSLFDAVQENGTVWGHISSHDFSHALGWPNR